MQYYLFLDVDGVLNHLTMYRSRQKSIDPDLDDHCLEALALLVKEISNLSIVISSTWRIIPYDMERLETAFTAFHIPKWIGVTPVCGSVHREDEILAWMKQHHVEKHQIVIVDDLSDFGSLQDRLIQTSFHDGGFQKTHVLQVIDLLKSK